MRILGYYDDHNAGAAVIEDGKILAAIEEERLSRIKLHNGNEKAHGQAWRALEEVLRLTGSDRSNIDAVAVPLMPAWQLQKYVLRDLFVRYRNWRWIVASLFSKSIRWDRYWLFYPYFYNKLRMRRIRKLLARYELADKPLHVTDHHAAHATSAYYASGRDRALVVTLDGQGDGMAGKVYLAQDGKMQLVREVSSFNSIGLFYNLVTWALGFKPNRHEGKVTGLAAHGDYKKVAELFESLFTYDGDFRYVLAERNFQHGYPHRTNYVKFLKSIPVNLQELPREDVAAGVQVLTERVVGQFVQELLDEYGPIDVCLAGGVFANVRVNQTVAELRGAKSVFIFPAMGDGGLSVGAAFQAYAERLPEGEKFLPIQLQDVYLGPEFTEEEIKQALDQGELAYEYVPNVEKRIAELLASGRVVARFNGRMEYGPRALGNRSILYQPTDPTVNDWLNKKLHRTEFMPFAPATLRERAEEGYHNIGANDFPAKFMTITFDCTDEMRENYPAVVHVDQTARPQFVDEKYNPSFYRIIKEYEKLTGLHSIINTSFNMHEEPIVCTPADAVRAFKLGHLDYLAIGNFLAANPVAARKEVNEVAVEQEKVPVA